MVVGIFLVSVTIAPKVSTLMFVFGNIDIAIPGMLIQLIILA